MDLKRVVMEQTDVATYLADLVSRVRNDALAITGLAWRHSRPGESDFEELHALSGSLERTAKILEAVKDRLCQICKVVDVAEHVTFGTVPEVGQEPKPEGGHDHGQEEGQERKAGRRKGRRR